jgi:hypothetical protein
MSLFLAPANRINLEASIEKNVVTAPTKLQETPAWERAETEGLRRVRGEVSGPPKE